MDTDKKDYTLREILENTFDLTDYDEAEKAKILDESSDLIMEATMLQLLNDSDEAMQEKFGKFLETEPNDEQMSQFITENFPKFGEVLLSEIKNFQEAGKADPEEDPKEAS